MGNKKLKLKIPLEESESTVLEETVALPFLDSRIRFSLKNCDTRDFCIRNLNTDEIKTFYKRLGYFEDITWRQMRQVPREKGFSVEKKGDSNHKMLSSMFPIYSLFFHFRITGLSNPFRVFVAQKEDLCYLLLLDKKGCINH